jgi:hypothetical protein
MEKFSRLSEITQNYLSGHLNKLVVNYDDEHTMHITVVYEDQNNYWFDYEIEIDLDHKKVNYGSHTSEGYLNKVRLNRENNFELAVCNALF